MGIWSGLILDSSSMSHPVYKNLELTIFTAAVAGVVWKSEGTKK